jgi:hypothetical protein
MTHNGGLRRKPVRAPLKLLNAKSLPLTLVMDYVCGRLLWFSANRPPSFAQIPEDRADK